MIPPLYAALAAAPAVTAIVGSPPRAYRHGSAPQDTTRPYITWFLLAGVPENELSDVPGIDRCTLQVDCWHQTDAGIEALAVAVRDAVEPLAHCTAVPINTREAETKLYRIALQFDWWLSRPEPAS